MARKFKCKDCRHSFELNKGDEETCPKCKSDNIQPSSGVMPVIGKFVLFVAMAAVGYFATDIVLNSGNDKELVVVNVPEDESSSGVDITDNSVSETLLAADSVQTEIVAVEETLEPIDSAIFTLSNVTLKQDGFSFFVQCEKIPVDYQVEQYKLFLKEDDTTPVLVAEASGEFKSDKYLVEEGKYFVQAIFINNNVTTLKPIEGIVKPATPAEAVKPKRMEKSELQKLINDAVANRNNQSLHQWYKGKDKRIKQSATVACQDVKLTGLAAMVRHGYTKKVKIEVLSVSYDSNNVIDAIEVAISK